MMMSHRPDSRPAPRWAGAIVLLAACLFIAALAWVMRLVLGGPPRRDEDDDAWTDGLELLAPVLATLH